MAEQRGRGVRRVTRPCHCRDDPGIHHWIGHSIGPPIRNGRDRLDVIIELLRTRRHRFLDRHQDSGDWYNRMFSAASYSLWSVSRPVMERHCRGSTLDAGSGRGAWRETIRQTGAEYESVDVAPRGGDTPTWIADVTDMPEIPDSRYDTVVCHQVLEHVRNPDRAMREFHRVLRAGGTLVLSVPHLSRRHELPRDYIRVSQEGVRARPQATSKTSSQSLMRRRDARLFI